jgi:DNA-binding protein HU-beta
VEGPRISASAEAGEVEISILAASGSEASLIEALVEALKDQGGVTLESSGTFTAHDVKRTRSTKPRAGEPVEVKRRKTMRFRANPPLKSAL